METTIQWVLAHGYPALFALLAFGILGIPIPGETIMVLAGAMVAGGKFHWSPAFAAAAGGSMCGITVSYAVGRFAGRWLASGETGWRKKIATRIAEGHEWLDRYGPPALMGGYFVPGVRHLTAVVAGMSEMRFRTFALFAYSGAALWVLTFFTIGWWAGEEWPRVAETIHHHLQLLKPALAVAVGLGLLWWFLSRRRSKPQIETEK